MVRAAAIAASSTTWTKSPARSRSRGWAVGACVGAVTLDILSLSRELYHSLNMVLLPIALTLLAADGDWAQWRGPDWNGVARGDAPVTWSDTEHIKWKAEIPGRGH